MKGYSPLRCWLREERQRDCGPIGAGQLFEVKCNLEDLAPRTRKLILMAGELGRRLPLVARAGFEYRATTVDRAFARIGRGLCRGLEAGYAAYAKELLALYYDEHMRLPMARPGFGITGAHS